MKAFAELLKYLVSASWSSREFGRLSNDCDQALQALEQCCKTNSCGLSPTSKSVYAIRLGHNETRYMFEEIDYGVEAGGLPQQFAEFLPQVQTIIAKRVAGSSTYQQLLEPDRIASLIADLRGATDSAQATQALFSLGGLFLRSDGRRALIDAGGPLAICNSMMHYALNMVMFVPHDVGPERMMLKSEETPIVPNALRQCFMALGGSEAGLRALAGCNILPSVNALLAAGSEVGGLSWSFLPSGPMIGSRQMSSLATVLLGLTCAVLPYIVHPSMEALFGIILAAQHEIEAGREGAQAHRNEGPACEANSTGQSPPFGMPTRIRDCHQDWSEGKTPAT